MYKYIRKFITKSALAFVLIVSVVSCESTQLEILDNPNALTPDQSDLNLFLNSIQLGTNTFFQQVNDEGMQVTRITNMAGPTYINAYAPTQFNGPWSTAYATVFADVNAMIPVAQEQGFNKHVGIAQILQAYIAMTLVDYFGDVPYSEAFTGEFLNPNVDSGADVYAAALQLLDDGIANVKSSGPNPTSDVFYGGDMTKWEKLANTLKIKMFLQTRLVDSQSASKINAIVSTGNFINDASEDFIFQYSSVNANPDSRHPQFVNNFENAGDVNTYMSNSYMDYMLNGKTMVDPRIRYYFYRQVAAVSTNPQDLPCIAESRPSHWPNDIVYCHPGDGYWGRDHGDNDGIPPDGALRTSYGLYPVGGPFDNDSFTATSGRDISTAGSGISPIMLSSYVHFMLAESALANNDIAGARLLLEAGVEQSLDKVINFRPDLVDEAYEPTTLDLESYVIDVLSLYDNAAGVDAKMEVIVREYWVALFGNGVEMYNTYRRTGKPAALQPTLNASPGSFIRSFLYPNNFVTANSNVSQKPGDGIETPVFWDTNSAGFVD